MIKGGRRRKTKKKKVRVAVITDQPSDSELTDDARLKQEPVKQPEILQVKFLVLFKILIGPSEKERNVKISMKV